MKYIKSMILGSSILLLLMNCSSSSNDPTPELTEEEKQINLLAKTWVLGTVEYRSDNVTDRFNGFTLTMTKGKTYSSTPDRGDYDYEPFKASGSWNFKSGSLNTINRNDGVEMEVSVTEKALILTFLITESNGRLAGLGEYRFELEAQ